MIMSRLSMARTMAAAGLEALIGAVWPPWILMTTLGSKHILLLVQFDNFCIQIVSKSLSCYTVYPIAFLSVNTLCVPPIDFSEGATTSLTVRENMHRGS
jgi:hypothetical protein